MNDEKRFKENMATLATVFNVDLTPFMITNYWEIFKGYDDDQFSHAVKQYLIRGKFFPKPVELIELIDGDQNQVAAEAWEVVLKGLRDSQNVVFSPEINRTVEMLGGAEYLGRMHERDLEFKRNQFMEIYQSVVITEGNKLDYDDTPRIEH